MEVKEAEIKELEEKMKLTLHNLLESAELSIKLKVKYPEHSARIKKYWADFGKHFINHVKRLEKDSGEEIVSGYSWTDLIKLIK